MFVPQTISKRRGFAAAAVVQVSRASHVCRDMDCRASATAPCVDWKSCSCRTIIVVAVICKSCPSTGVRSYKFAFSDVLRTSGSVTCASASRSCSLATVPCVFWGADPARARLRRAFWTRGQVLDIRVLLTWLLGM